MDFGKSISINVSQTEYDEIMRNRNKCSTCNGTGLVGEFATTCSRCNGNGSSSGSVYDCDPSESRPLSNMFNLDTTNTPKIT